MKFVDQAQFELEVQRISEEQNILPFVVRIMFEKKDLGEKLDKLKAYMDSNSYLTLKDKDRDLLTEQFEAMSKYYAVLSARFAKYYKGE